MSRSKDFDLANFELLAGLTAEQRAYFSQHLKELDYAAGEEIFHEGAKGGAIFFLLSGDVEISQSLTLSVTKQNTNYDAREKSIIRLSGKDGAVFGEVSLFGHEDKRTATVTALTDCHMGTLSGKQFFKILEDHIEVGYQVMQNLTRIVCGRLVVANRNVLKLTTALSLVLEK
ncbi:MAG: cyclic nucleotide-binding domain-containing protein [Candidatus Marinimicrobia bacterium]|nr:cyclic nucleotide-binding domain-containing protein [Candidatus Neomarinimicrobiota bacterium]